MMADRVLFVGWGETVRGREERAMEVFNEAVGLIGRMQQEGRIESFDVVLLNPNSTIQGFMLARGTTAQIDALKADEEFLRNTVDAQLIVDNVTHIEGYTNEGVAKMMGMFQEAIAKVPQSA
jgi:hypothetical protein